MRVNVDKYLFIGRKKSEFFSACRELGAVEFLAKNKLKDSENVRRISEGLKVLNVLTNQYPSEDLVAAKSGYLTTEQLLQEIFDIDQEITTITDSLKALEKEIVRVKPLGNFSSEEIRELTLKTGLAVRFFYKKHIEGAPLEIEEENVFYLATAYNYDYYVVIGVVSLSKDVFTEIEAPRSVNELREEEARLQNLLRRKRARVCELHAYREDLLEALCEQCNEQTLQHAEASAENLFDDKVFSALGWVIADRLDAVQKVCDSLGVYLERVQPDPDEVVPTYLENHGLGALGESLVNIYDTPASTDKDPSLWVFLSFFVFFSMIINDAGYGLVFLATSLFLSFKARKQVKHSLALKRFLKMVTLLGLGCICWGGATTSFFGMSVSYTSSFRKYSLTHFLAMKKAEYYLKERPKGYKELVHDYPVLKDKKTPEEFLLAQVTSSGDSVYKAVVYDKFTDNILMEIALLVGVIHLSLGMLRYCRQRYSSIGWVVFMCGAYMYLPIYLQAVSFIHYALHVPYELGGQIGYYITFIGLGCAVLGGIIQRGLRGLDEITAVIQVFSDVLSYLRLYALSLAGAMVGNTVMVMSERFSPAVGVLIIIFGHTVNIALSIMGGVIHGLRLNFIEWYHYSFDGGGKLLHPLRRIVCQKSQNF